MTIVTKITTLFRSWPLIILIFGVSMVFSIELKFLQFRKFGFIMKNTFGKVFDKNISGEGTVTPFQAVSTALAATVGVGNIVGVGVAISIGGPGSIFWMWIVAFIAMIDRKSTRLNSSHANISYAVFCLKKKKKTIRINPA